MATKKNTTLEETDAKKGGAATKSPFSAKFLKQQREMLISERATYERQADILQAEAESLTADREPGDEYLRAADRRSPAACPSRT